MSQKVISNTYTLYSEELPTSLVLRSRLPVLKTDNVVLKGVRDFVISPISLGLAVSPKVRIWLPIL